MKRKGSKALTGLYLSTALVAAVAAPAISTFATGGLPNLTANQITAVNNKAAATDKVIVSAALAEDDVVNVYKADGTVIGTATVTADDETAGTITVDCTVQFPQNTAGIGTIYVSITRDTDETARVAKAFSSDKSAALTPDVISVSNSRAGATNADKVAVLGLKTGDVVKVYANPSTTTALGASSALTADYDTATVSLANQLASNGGTVYVAVARADKAESARVAVKYGTDISAPLTAAQVAVTNVKTVANDKVVVSNLQPGDTVKVFDKSTGGTQLGSSATVASDATSATVALTTSQLSANGGTVYVAVERKDKAISPSRLAVRYDSHKTAAPSVNNIVVMNNDADTNSGTDVIRVTGLKPGDTVKVYSAATGTTPAFATSAAVADSKRSVSFDITDTTKLAANGGKLYITVTGTDKDESARVVKEYTAD